MKTEIMMVGFMILGIALTILKLMGVIQISWLAAFIPIILAVALPLISLLFVIILVLLGVSIRRG